MNIQENLRNEVKKLKWKEDITYKVIAEDLLNMNSNSFYNWLKGYRNLGTTKIKILKDFINTISE